VAGNAVYIQPDTSGQHLFYASYGDNEAAVYPIGIDGLVRPKFTWKATTQSHPHSIGARPHHPSLVVVPDTGSSIVQTYYFDNQAGSLSLASTTAMPDKTGQRHFVFGEQHFFTVNETASSVTAYKYAGKDGSFKPQQTLSTLPSAHEGHNSCADIHFTPDSRFLYVSNRGHDSIAGFALASNERPLTFLGTTATEHTPREFAIDPAGSYLYAAGQKSGNVAAYKIHNDGNLERFATYAVGKNPTWVLATTISRP
jgi:6-phosphogluconolactonase